MKYILRLEELSPSVYDDAGRKLYKLNQANRGNKLIKYAEEGKPNLEGYPYLIDGGSYKFHRFEFLFDHQGILPDGSFNIDSIFKNFKDDELTEMFIEISSSFISKSGKIKNAIYFFIDLSMNGKARVVKKGWQGSFFDDRKSAILYKKEILPKIFDIVPLSDFCILANIEIDIYKNILECIETISTNQLYVDKHIDSTDIVLYEKSARRGRIPKSHNEMKRFTPSLDSLISETSRLLSRLTDMNFNVDITEDYEFYFVKISLGNYWQKNVPGLSKWSKIKMDIINYLHHVCDEFSICRDVIINRNNVIDTISLKRLESLVDCNIRSIEFKFNK